MAVVECVLSKETLDSLKAVAWSAQQSASILTPTLHVLSVAAQGRRCHSSKLLCNCIPALRYFVWYWTLGVHAMSVR